MIDKKIPKTCIRCDSALRSDDRHRLCPRCRFAQYNRWNLCNGCEGKKQILSSLCIRCHNKSNKKSVASGKIAKKYTSSSGYVTMYVPNHPRNKRHIVQEHVIVMEAFLGRYLLPGENVHHKNGIRNDNRLENLELWCKPQPSGVCAEDAYNWAIEIVNRYNILYSSNNNQ